MCRRKSNKVHCQAYIALPESCGLNVYEGEYLLKGNCRDEKGKEKHTSFAKMKIYEGKNLKKEMFVEE